MKFNMSSDRRPLYQRLLDAGYVFGQNDHHGSDLYVFVTPTTTRIVEQWCRDNGYTRAWMCPIFKDQITGMLMYDCAFQYIPVLKKKEESKYAERVY